MIGAEQGANGAPAPGNDDAAMGAPPEAPPSGTATESPTLTTAPASANSNSTSGLMALSDDDSVEPATYGIVSPSNSSHSLALGFKQEPIMETDPRYA